MLDKRSLTGAVTVLLLTIAGSVIAPAALATATGNCRARPAPRVYWNGCDLANANLSNANLYGCLLYTSRCSVFDDDRWWLW